MVDCVKKNRYVCTSILFLGLCVASFFLMKPAKAEEIIFYETSGTPATYADDWEQEFIATTSNITSFDLYTITAYPAHQIQIALCKGSIYGSCYNGGDWCEADPSNELIKTVIYPNKTASANSWTNFSFTTDDVGNLDIGEKYFICYDYYGNGSGINYRGYTNSTMPGNSDKGATTTTDIALKLYHDPYYDFGTIEVIDLPEWQGNIQIGSEIDLQYNRRNFCYVGQDCFLNFNYGYDVIGAQLLLYEFDTALFLDSTTLEDQQILTTSFLMAPEDSETTEQYCIILDEVDAEPVAYCDIEIQWIEVGMCDSATICSDVATSSDFLYGVQCGFREGICWMFKPTPASLTFFSKSVQNFEESAPFNLAFDLINTISTKIETASTTTGGEFGIPWISTSTGEYEIEYGIDMNSYNEILGVSTTNMITEYTEYFVYIIISALMLLIIVKFAIL